MRSTPTVVDVTGTRVTEETVATASTRDAVEKADFDDQAETRRLAEDALRSLHDASAKLHAATAESAFDHLRAARANLHVIIARLQ